MRWPLVEQWLDGEKIKWQFEEGFPISKIDLKASLLNQARFEQLDKEKVEAIGKAAIENKGDVPAVIGYFMDSGLIKLCDGNSRSQALNNVGFKKVDLYLLLTHDEMTIDTVTRSANDILNGNRNLPKDSMRSAHDYQLKWGLTSTETAKRLKIRQPWKYKSYVYHLQVSQRLIAGGLKPAEFLEGFLDLVAPLKLDSILIGFCKLQLDYKLPLSTVGEMATRLKKLGTSEKIQLAKIAEFRAELAKKKQPVEPGAKAIHFNTQSYYQQLTRHLEAIIKLTKEQKITPIDQPLVDKAQIVAKRMEALCTELS
jgi:hypothetical protein